MTNFLNQDDATLPDASEEQVPSMLLGADLHNIGNSNSGWFDPTTWPDRGENALKFGAVSILSGGAPVSYTHLTLPTILRV